MGISAGWALADAFEAWACAPHESATCGEHDDVVAFDPEAVAHHGIRHRRGAVVANNWLPAPEIKNGHMVVRKKRPLGLRYE